MNLRAPAYPLITVDEEGGVVSRLPVPIAAEGGNINHSAA